MANLINFILESTLWLAIFYLAYQIFLQQIKWPVFNRFFLLGGLVFSFVLQLVHFNIWQTQLPAIIIKVGEAVENVSRDTFINSVNGNESGINLSLPLIIYLSVAGIFFIYFSISLLQVYLYKKNPERLPQNLMAFSFFNFIYLHPQLKSHEDSDLILNHENAHASQWHSFDILLLQIIRVACWANPVLWIYHKPMRENHEYLADQVVLQKYPRREIKYQQLILKLHLSSLSPALVNNFNFFSYKKRITMINKKPMTNRGKMMLSFAMMMFVISLIACKETIDNIEPDQIYLLSEVDKSEKPTGKFDDFYEHVQKNLKYPAIARNNEVESTLFISFSISELGKVENISVNREKTLPTTLPKIIVVGYGKQKLKNVPKLGLKDLETENPPVIPAEKLDIKAGEAALENALIEALDNSPLIKSFTKNQKPIKVKLELPVQFKLG